MSTIHTRVTTALQQAADLIAAHPALPIPYVAGGSWGTVDVSYYVHLDTNDLAKQKATAAEIVRSLDGHWAKDPNDERFDFTQTRGDLRLRVTVHRDAVCERVVVGTESVTVPAREAEVIEAQPERTEEREVVEWRCSSLLADTEHPVAVSA